MTGLTHILASGGFQTYYKDVPIADFERDLSQSEKEGKAFMEDDKVRLKEGEGVLELASKDTESQEQKLSYMKSNPARFGAKTIEKQENIVKWMKERLKFMREGHDLSVKIHDISANMHRYQEHIWGIILKDKIRRDLTIMFEILQALPGMTQADQERTKLRAKMDKVVEHKVAAQEKLEALAKSSGDD
jgi:exonuclease VII large subunit